MFIDLYVDINYVNIYCCMCTVYTIVNKIYYSIYVCLVMAIYIRLIYYKKFKQKKNFFFAYVRIVSKILNVPYCY